MTASLTGIGLTMKKGRWAMGFLILFIIGDLWVHVGPTLPVVGRAGSQWTFLGSGPYEAAVGRFGRAEILLPDAPGLPVLTVEEGSSGPVALIAHPSRQIEFKGLGRVSLWGRSEIRLATVSQNGAALRVPLAPDGQSVLVTPPQGSGLDLVTLGKKPESLALLPKVIAGVSLVELQKKANALLVTGAIPRAWTPVWAEAPFFDARGQTVYYFSNRLEAVGSPSTELWAHVLKTGSDRLIYRGVGLAAFGIDALGRVLLTDLQGQLVAVGPEGSRVLGTGVRPVAVQPGGQRALVEDLANGSLLLLDLISDKSAPIDLGGDRFAGSADFSPDGAYVAVVDLDPSSREGVMIFRMTASGPRLFGEVAPPSAHRIVIEAPPSWLDGDRLVLVLADLRARLGTWTVQVHGASGL